MEHFTPVSASIGGVLIGLSATMLWFVNGRIAGVSGIVGGLWTAQAGDIAWRIAFAIGLIAAPVALRDGEGRTAAHHGFGPLAAHRHRRAPGRIWHSPRRRLHQRSWRLRYCPVLAALARGHWIVHGDGHRNQLHPASSDRALTSWLPSSPPLFPACFLVSDSPFPR